MAVWGTAGTQTPPQRDLHHYQGHSFCTALVSFVTWVCVRMGACVYVCVCSPESQRERRGTETLDEGRKLVEQTWWTSRPLSPPLMPQLSPRCPSGTRHILPLHSCFGISSTPQSRTPAPCSAENRYHCQLILSSSQKENKYYTTMDPL